MKISHRKITASTYVKAATIPEPFAEYYEPISDLEFERQFDYPAHPSPCEEIPGYDVKFITYIQAKPEYAELLYDKGFDTLELISEGGSDPFVAYTVGDRIYTLDEDELGLDEWAEDIDVDWAKRSEEDARRRVENSHNQQDLQFAEMKLQRALNRLRVSSMQDKK